MILVFDNLLAQQNSNTSNFHWINWLIVAIYLLGMVGVGFYFSKREKTTDNFFRGGQRIPWVVASLSMFATKLSSLTYMALPGAVFAGTWVYLGGYIGMMVVMPIIVWAYLPFFRGLNVTSAYEYLEKRFNLTVRCFGSLSFMAMQLAKATIVLLLPAMALEITCGLSVYYSIIIVGFLCIIYTVMGGIEAVVWTDAIQAVVLMLGAIVCFALIFFKCDMSVNEFWSIANSNGKILSEVSFFGSDGKWPSILEMTFLVMLLNGFFDSLISYSASQEVVQRYVTTSNMKKAKKSIWLNAIFALPAGVLFMSLGTALFVFYHVFPEKMASDGISGNKILPFFIVNEMPIGLAGLIIAGIFAASQSTLSSSLNSIATCYVTDFQKRFNPNVPDSQSLKLAKLVTVYSGALMIGFACFLALINNESLWNVFLSIIGLLAGPLAGVFALGVFTRKANNSGAITGLVVSGFIVGTMFIMAKCFDKTVVTGLLYGPIAVTICIIVGYATSCLTAVQSKDLAGLTIYTRQKNIS